MLITTGKVHDTKKWEAMGWYPIDVTVKSAKPAARSLTPTWDMVKGYQRGTVSEEEYTKRYMQILRRSLKENPNRWKATVSRFPAVVFLCYCPTGNFCHRHLLAQAMVKYAHSIGIEATVVPEGPPSPPKPSKTTDSSVDTLSSEEAPESSEGSSLAHESLTAAVAAIAIEGFQGEYRFLSNFWPAKIRYEGDVYDTTEHAFQASKTLIPAERREIKSAATPAKAKRLGKKVTLRDDWNQIKDSVMLDITKLKYALPELKEKLLATGDKEIIESNEWHDYYWGVCNGKGQNKLGKILMQVREEIRTEQKITATYYAGIGSRETFPVVCGEMTIIARRLEKNGCVLRSGGAQGADKAFERGVSNPFMKEIFCAKDCLPWAKEEVKKHIPSDRPPLEKMNPYVQALISRDMMQVLGKDGHTPVSFVVCWTPKGKDDGGTGYAIRCAKAHNIPVYNLNNEKDRKSFYLDIMDNLTN